MVLNGARAKIVIEGEGLRHEITADSKGRYEAELTPGLYRISAVVNSWYYPFRRAAFRLLPNEATVINIIPAERLLAVNTQILPNVGFRDTAETMPPPEYETFSPPGISRTPFELLVRYARKQKGRGFIEYKKAMVSYNALTIYAGQIRLYKNRFRIEASGNDVVVEDGKQRVRVREALIDFKSGNPVINLKKGAIEKVEGDGALKAGGVTFKFSGTRDSVGSIEHNTENQLYYSDPERGISITSNWYYMIVTNEAQNTVMLKGTACASGRDPLTKKFNANGCRPVTFIATIRDGSNGKQDEFSILIEDIEEYSHAGTLSSGDIQVIRN
jgi:hypothetical protein